MKDTSRILILMLLLLSINYSLSFGQSIIAADGGQGGTGKVRIEWTLGEFAIETLQTPNGLLTQGFHQPGLQVVRIPSPDIGLALATPASLKVHLAPNPVQDLLNIKIDHDKDMPIQLRLLDANGRILLQQKTLTPNQIELNLSKYASGLYFLQFHQQEGQPIETYKISKH